MTSGYWRLAAGWNRRCIGAFRLATNPEARYARAVSPRSGDVRWVLCLERPEPLPESTNDEPVRRGEGGRGARDGRAGVRRDDSRGRRERRRRTQATAGFGAHRRLPRSCLATNASFLGSRGSLAADERDGQLQQEYGAHWRGAGVAATRGAVATQRRCRAYTQRGDVCSAW